MRDKRWTCIEHVDEYCIFGDKPSTRVVFRFPVLRTVIWGDYPILPDFLAEEKDYSAWRRQLKKSAYQQVFRRFFASGVSNAG